MKEAEVNMAKKRVEPKPNIYIEIGENQLVVRAHGTIIKRIAIALGFLVLVITIVVFAGFNIRPEAWATILTLIKLLSESIFGRNQ
jgi:hypothetical protein